MIKLLKDFWPVLVGIMMGMVFGSIITNWIIN